MAKFRAIVNAVRQAITGNATTADVLSGKTFMSSASPNEQTGSMTNRGAVSDTMTANGTYTIPEGYHNGQGEVIVNVAQVQPTLLWTNEAPSSAFTAQTVSLDLTNYSGVIIAYRGGTTFYAYVEKNSSGVYLCHNSTNARRPIVLIDNTGVQFDSAIKNADNTGDNNACVPLYIWGTNLTLNTQ